MEDDEGGHRIVHVEPAVANEESSEEIDEDEGDGQDDDEEEDETELERYLRDMN